MIYIVHQGDDLKSHLSMDPEGNEAICGHYIEHYDKEVERLNLKGLNYLIEFILDDVDGKGNICKRCHKIFKSTARKARSDVEEMSITSLLGKLRDINNRRRG